MKNDYLINNKEQKTLLCSAKTFQNNEKEQKIKI